VEYKKAPDLATRKELCDQTRGRRSLAWEEAKPKRISNIQAKFRQSWRRRGGASPNTAIAFSSINRWLTMFLIFMSVIKNNGCACSFCNSDSGDGAAHRRRRREASRCKT
jgi:hypothetical protein